MKPSNPIMINALSAASNKNSAAINATFMVYGSIQASFSDSAAAGTLVLQGSNDPEELLPAGAPPINWVNLAGATATVVAGASVNVGYVPYVTGSFRWLRAVWTHSAGAGTITVTGFFQGV